MNTRKAVLVVAYTNYQTDPRVIRQAEAAVSGGFEVDVIALRREGDPVREVIRGVRVLHVKQTRYRGGRASQYLRSYLKFFLRCCWKISWLQIARRYRVIHVNNMPDFFVFAAVVPKMMGAKVLLDIHDPMPNTFASKFKNAESGLFFNMLLWQERLSASFADQVLTVHDPVKDHILVKQHGLKAASIVVIANFADDEIFPLRDPTPVHGKVRLVFHGSVLERYGLRTAMIAIARMRHQERIELKIIGEGDFSGKLRELIKALGLEKIVHFDNRMYPLQEIPERLAGCHLGLVPLDRSSITHYALPLKLLEYLSLGMPSVTVRNAAIGYYFSEDDCLFYEPEEPESLRFVLDRVAENPDVLGHYQRRAAELRGRFLWSTEKQKYITMLHKLASTSRAEV